MIRRNPLPTSRSHRLTILLLVLLLLLVGWILYDRSTSQQSAELAADNAASIAAQVRAACERRGLTAIELGDLCRQAEQIEERPAETIPGRPPTADEIEAAVETVLTERPGLIRSELIAATAAHLTRNPPDPGEDAPPPTAEQVFAAVAQYCAGDACKGDDAAPLTQAQIDSAFVTFCATRDDCRGADAPQLTQAEVDAAFQRFCANDACRGDDGRNGTDGDDSTVPGPAGRGIVSVEFVNGGDCRMVITYTDETEDVFGGMPASMCKASDSEQPESP
jgi:hypothetical protein